MAATKATGHFEHLELRIRLSSTSDGACIPQVIGTCAGIGCPSAVYAWLQLCYKGPMHPDYICPMEANRWSATWICPKSINISHVQQEKGFGIRDMLTNFDLKRMNLQWMQPARQASGCISGGLERCPSCYTLHSVLWRGNLRLPWDEPKMKAIWPRLLSTAQVSMLKSDGCRNTPRGPGESQCCCLPGLGCMARPSASPWDYLECAIWPRLKPSETIWNQAGSS